MLWFNFSLGLKFYFLFFLVMVMHDNEFDNTIQFHPRTKLNHNIYSATTQGFRPLKSHSDLIKHHTSC